MQLLKDTYFDSNKKLILEEPIIRDFERDISIIRDLLSPIFTYYYSSIVEGISEEVILDNLKTKFVELGRGIDIDFINNLKFYIDVNGKLNLWTLMPNNKHSESSVITLVNSGNISNSAELEEVLEKYRESHVLNINNKDYNKVQSFFKKTKFKYSEHTNTYLKPIYIKGSFDGDINNDLINNARNFFKELDYGSKGISWDLHSSFAGSPESDLKQEKPVKIFKLLTIFPRKGTDGSHDYDMDVFLIDDELIVLSVTEKFPIELLDKFLKEAYVKTKEKLQDNVKGNIDSILMNFSNEKSNIINQYNYHVLKNGIKGHSAFSLITGYGNENIRDNNTGGSAKLRKNILNKDLYSTISKTKIKQSTRIYFQKGYLINNDDIIDFKDIRVSKEKGYISRANNRRKKIFKKLF